MHLFLCIFLDKRLIVHDAVELKKGAVKLKVGGSSGSNGVKDIVKRAGSAGFPRLQLGIGRPETQGADLAQWVLGCFRSTDADSVRVMLESSLKSIITFIEDGIEQPTKDSSAPTKATKTSSKKLSSSTTTSVLLSELLKRSDYTLLESIPALSDAETVVG